MVGGEARGIPAHVQEFAGKVQDADVPLIAMPAYNYGIPGVLENGIEAHDGQTGTAGRPGGPEVRRERQSNRRHMRERLGELVEALVAWSQRLETDEPA